ncbi:MAG: hypothetical protein EB084_08255 [Proteobacteria bacterium]|nr:hypothetical protein [Pseudomonadota bacterium]
MTVSAILESSNQGNEPIERATPSARDTSRASAPRSTTVVESRESSTSPLTPQDRRDGFTPRATALTTNDGVRRVLLDMLGDRGVARPGMTSGGVSDEAAAYRSSTPVPLEGYNYDKLNDPSVKTPKYIFGRVAQGYKLDSVKGDKAKAEVLLTAMLPELRANGLEVVSVKGDRIQVKTEIGYEWVDVIRAAGGDNPGWQWGSEGKGTPQPTGSVQEWAAATGVGMDGGAGGGAGMGGVSGGGFQNPNAGVLGSAIDRGAVMAILEKYPPTNEGIRQAMPELQKKFPGVELIEHPKRLDKLKFPNGAVIDVIVSAGAPDAKWGWMPEN